MKSKLRTAILANSLWLVGLGLCLASSGIDGAYMVRWMPSGADWLGYVLNAVADVAAMVIMHKYSSLQQMKRNQTGAKRKLKMARVLLGCEGVAVSYSWFFSWRQLRLVLPLIERGGIIVPILGYVPHANWVALIAAGYIPLLLAFVGYAQALDAAPDEVAKPTTTQPEPQPVAEPEPLPVASIGDWRKIYAGMDGNRAGITADDVAEAVSAAGFEPPARRTLQNWAREAQE